jgi:shikimate dehydrogenase
VLPRIVDGATRILAIVGDPIAQVRSPPMWSALFRYNNLNAICVPFHVRPADLSTFADGLRAAANVLGLLVTIPHKLAAARHADALTPRAEKVGSANLLRPLANGGWEGEMLDGHGFVLALRADGQRIEGRRALVVGAGGVGSAIAFALAEAGAAHVAISDIDASRAATLARRIEDRASTPSSVVAARAEGLDLIVNASPLGMRADDPLPLDLSGLSVEAIVGDVVIGTELTPVLKAARARGCHVQPGAAMTDHQVAAQAVFLGLESGDWGPDAIRAAMCKPSPGIDGET